GRDTGKRLPIAQVLDIGGMRHFIYSLGGSEIIIVIKDGRIITNGAGKRSVIAEFYIRFNDLLAQVHNHYPKSATKDRAVTGHGNIIDLFITRNVIIFDLWQVNDLTWF